MQIAIAAGQKGRLKDFLHLYAVQIYMTERLPKSRGHKSHRLITRSHSPRKHMTTDNFEEMTFYNVQQLRCEIFEIFM